MKKWIGLLLAFGAYATAYAQYTVSGTITDNASRKLSDASIHLVSSGKTSRSVLSDIEGQFAFSNVSNGTYELHVSYIGFITIKQTVVVNNASSENINITMEASSVLGTEVLVQATRARSNDANTFATVTRQDIAKQNFGQDIPMLLNLTPSAVVSSDAGAGIGYTGIRIRGVDPSRTNVTINGMPVNDAESQGTFWVNMPDLASSVDNIQVQRGVGTSTNGGAAFGASINMQTDGLNDKPYAEAANSYGSFNTRKHTFKAGTGLLDSRWAFDARLSQIKSDGFIDRASSDLKSFFVSGARYGKRSLLKANIFSGKEVTYQAWNGVPQPRLTNDVAGMTDFSDNMGNDLNHLLNSNSRTYNEFTYKNQVDNYQQDFYQLFYSYRLNSNLKLNAGLFYTYGRGYYEEYRADEKLSKYKLNDVIIGSDTITKGDFVRRRWLDNNFYGAIASAIYEKNRITFTLGGGVSEYDGKHFGELIWAEYASNSQPGTHFYDGRSTKKDGNVYAKLNYRFTEKFSAFADLQYRGIDYTLKGEDLNSSTYIPYNLHLTYSFFNPKGGITYAFNAQTNVYAYFGVANREPERKDIIQSGNGIIPKPERLYNYEIGFRKNMLKYAYAVNFYYMDYTNQLVSTGQLNDVGAYNRVNVPSSYRAGVELTGGIQPVKQFKWQVTATYSQNRIKSFTEFVDDWDNGGQVTTQYKNKSIAFSPDWVVSSIITVVPVKQLGVDLISKFVSEQYLDNTENKGRSLNSFFVNDIRINYDLPVTWIFSSVRVGLLVNNVLNEKYEPNGATYSAIIGSARHDFNYLYPQAGTNYLANLVLKF